MGQGSHCLLIRELDCSFYDCRNAQQSSLSNEDHLEKANRSNFVQGLLFSTIMDDGL